MSASILLRSASILQWISKIGLCVPSLIAIYSLSQSRGIPFVLGFPAYGGGFERHRIVTSIPILFGFLVLCLIEGYAGWLLWNAHKAGGLLALILHIPGAVYWWGFDLPYPSITAIIRTFLIVKLV